MRYNILLLSICLFCGINVKAQLYIKQSNSAYLFYHTSKVRVVAFIYKASEGELMNFKSITDSVIDVTIDTIKEGTCFGHFTFHRSIDASDFRLILRRLGQTAMYVNDIKILRQSLLTEMELKYTKQVVFEIDESKASANLFREANSLHATLSYARMHNYPKRLYSGEITKLEEDIYTVLNSIKGN